jgi:hypothetical protein
MDDYFDHSFEENRINQLVKQFLLSEEIKGTVVFGCLEKENILNYSTWFFDDDTNKNLKESGFRDLLLRLIDNLREYRASFNLPLARDGIIEIYKSSASISWLKDGEAGSLIDAMKLKETN